MARSIFLVFFDMEIDDITSPCSNVLEIAMKVIDKDGKEHGDYEAAIYVPEIAIHKTKFSTTALAPLLDICPTSQISLVDAEHACMLLLDNILKRHEGKVPPQFVLAGQSPRALDLPGLRSRLPSLSRYLHQWQVFDITTLITQQKLGLVDLPLTRDYVANHRAMLDVNDALEVFRKHRQWCHFAQVCIHVTESRIKSNDLLKAADSKESKTQAEPVTGNQLVDLFKQLLNSKITVPQSYVDMLTSAMVNGVKPPSMASIVSKTTTGTEENKA